MSTGAADALRFSLIGCGQQGRELAGALAQVPGVRLVACSDPDTKSLQGVPGPTLVRYSDHREMLDEIACDAVIVATSHDALAAAALAALESGRHTFCEKPMARCAAEARPVVEAARRHGVNLMVGYVQRFDPLRQRMKAFLDSGAFGELSYVVAGKGGPPLMGWQQSRGLGGGQLLWVGSHLTDQLHWLLGRRVQRVYAEVRRAPEGVDLTSVATLRFDDGLVAHLDCSQAAPDVYDYVEAVGVDGYARAEWRPHYGIRIQTRRIAEYATPQLLTGALHPLEREYLAELIEFTSSIREARAPRVTGDDGLRVLEVLDAIALSAESGQPVTLRGLHQ